MPELPMTMTPLSCDVDLFSDECLAYPYDVYRMLREIGAVVYLSRCQAYAVTQFDAARTALADYKAFSSVRGVTLNAAMNAFQAGKTLLGTDPPLSTKLRGILAGALGPEKIRQIETTINEQADVLVQSLVEKGEFDAIADLARVLPVNIVCDLIGLPATGRHRLIHFADMHFNAFGPLGDHLDGPVNERAAQGWEEMQTATAFIGFMAQRLKPGGVGAAIYEAAATGAISEEEAFHLLSTFLVASLDTTVRSIGTALHCFAIYPDQWRLLRANPSLIPAAFNEVLRFDSPSQVLTRSTTGTCELGGYALPGHARVAIIFASANRDESRYHHSDQFRIDREPRSNLSFGGGPHVCLGQALARMEAHAVIGALVRHVSHIELAGAPERLLNSVLRGYARLPVRVRPTRSVRFRLTALQRDEKARLPASPPWSPPAVGMIADREDNLA